MRNEPRSRTRLPFPSVLLGATALCLLAPGCSDDPITHADVRGRLTQARALWDVKGSDDYDFEFRWSCFCDPAHVALVRLTVVDGSVQSAIYLEDDTAVPADQLARYRTIDGLFDLIQGAIDGGADSITAEFDASRGFPTQVAIDYEFGAADEELGFQVRSVAIR